MTDIDLKPLTEAQLPQLQRLTDYAFAVNSPVADQAPALLQPQWTLGAFDGATLAACSGAFPFTAQLNGNRCAVQGITAVATDPSYRRQGLLRKMLRRWMERAQSDDIAFSLLWASLGAIYQRFGYGLGSADVSYSAQTRDLAFTNMQSASGGQVYLVNPDQTEGVDDLLASIHRQFIEQRNLILHRNAPAWRRLQRATPTHIAIYRTNAGSAEGAVLYTTNWDGPPGPDAQQTIKIIDLMWLNQRAYLALWRFLLQHDLANKIDWVHAPADDPLPLLLLEPRRLHKRVDDGTWLRIVDVKSGLQRRGYLSAGQATIKLVGDDLCPWNNGLWRFADTRYPVCYPLPPVVPRSLLSREALGAIRTRNWKRPPPTQNLDRW